MTVRAKLLASMTLLVLLMAGAFFTLSRGYLVYQFRQYATTAENQEAAQWMRVIKFYYTSNGNSWQKVTPLLQDLLREQSGTSDSGGGERTSHVVGANPTSTGNSSQDKDDQVDHLIVEDSKGNKVLNISNGDLDTAASTPADVDSPHMTPYPLVIGSQFRGTLYVGDTSPSGLIAVENRVLRSMTFAIVWGMLLATAAALTLGYFLSRRITDPLHRLSGAILQMGRGDWDVEVNVSGQDEVGKLAGAFDEMRDQLRTGEQVRKQLVADVAHELRTPLTILEGQLELVQQGVKPATPEAFVPMLDEVIRLTGLVEDLHQLSLADAGQLPLNRQETDLMEIVTRIVENFSMEAESRTVALTIDDSAARQDPTAALFGDTADGDAHAAHAFAQVDPRRITQVLVNLIDNALTHTPSGGGVRVAVSSYADFVTIAVADTGPGIPPDHLPHVFDRFYRADNNRSRAMGGMGLGLAIAKGFAEAHGGTIEVTSQLGKGTTFTVILPHRAPGQAAEYEHHHSN